MNHKISFKNAEGRWRAVGNVRENKFGNLQVSLKMGDDLREAMVAAKNKGTDWLNLALFPEDEEKRIPEVQRFTSPIHKVSNHDEEEILF